MRSTAARRRSRRRPPAGDLLPGLVTSIRKRGGNGRCRPVAGIPRTADGKPDFSGIWQTLSAADYDLEPHSARKDAPPGAGVVEGKVIPYQPWALEQRKKNFEARATADPRTKCFTLGTPRGIYGQEPFQIFQRPRDLTIVFQFGHPVRTIHTNGTRHPKGPIGFWSGDWRGHWEGDTLVVDVTDFNGETWLDRAGNFHGDALHVVERWTFLRTLVKIAPPAATATAR